ncbi:sugar transferase [Oleiharenicola sp. Vm1]|uniref:sugar transferase n=1 Tax=Oleiharenicola sp. Vm1 TaxID=3398393 RepID=UPI0039F5380D
MAKRLFDIVVSFFGLLFLSPFLLIFMLLIWLQDYCNPFYIAPRARARGRTFNMVKLRSMVKNADKLGGASTAANDRRITWVGKLIRKTKFDEVPQLWNVLKGEMSLVGPRPQVMKDVALYTEEEYHLFDVRPGITDFASIVFADEGDILRGAENPDLKYNQVIRPWKSRLGLFYGRHHNLVTDVALVVLTVLSAVSRARALAGVQGLLRRLGADEQLIAVAGRSVPLVPFPPPGADAIETRF